MFRLCIKYLNILDLIWLRSDWLRLSYFLHNKKMWQASPHLMLFKWQSYSSVTTQRHVFVIVRPSGILTRGNKTEKLTLIQLGHRTFIALLNSNFIIHSLLFLKFAFKKSWRVKNESIDLHMQSWIRIVDWIMNIFVCLSISSLTRAKREYPGSRWDCIDRPLLSMGPSENFKSLLYPYHPYRSSIQITIWNQWWNYKSEKELFGAYTSYNLGLYFNIITKWKCYSLEVSRKS